MTHQYSIHGMSCNGCKMHVEEIISKIDGVEKVSVDLKEGLATIEMEKHIPLEDFQKAFQEDGGNYSIDNLGVANEERHPHQHIQQGKGNGVFYCPMHCEGDKTYHETGNCPVCGMDLVEEISLQNSSTAYICPMHCEGDKTYPQPGNCPVCGMDLVPFKPNISAEEKKYKELSKKFWISVGFTLPIFFIAMYGMFPNNFLHRIFPMEVWNWIEFLLSIPVVFYATWMFFQRAYSSIVRWNLNMFTLIGIGAGIAWSFSFIGLLFPDIFPTQFKDNGHVHLYFESATVILTLVLMGQLLEAKAHSKTNSAVKELLKLYPNDAYKIVNGKEIKVSVDAIMVDDLLRIKSGDKIPVDGIITEGETSIDESMITGEPIPIYKRIGDKVIAGTINGNQSVVIKAEKIGSETLLSQIIELVNKASRSQAPIQRLADKISAYFVPIVVGIAVLTFFIWWLAGPQPSLVYGFINAVAVLIIACPCALGLATPMSVMVGIGKGAQNGILIKDAKILEQMYKVDTLVVDKTGTITEGKPSVEKIISAENFTHNDIIQLASSLNKHSNHPLSKAIITASVENNISTKGVTDFKEIPGMGVTGKIDNQTILLGNKQLMNQFDCKFSEDLLLQSTEELKRGKTLSYLSAEGIVVGFIVIYDKIKTSSKEAIKRLQNHGIKVIMLTGDNSASAKAVAHELDLFDFKAEMLPTDKLREVEKLQNSGKIVAMAGDGINDAPALTQANIGIAMDGGTAIAIESSDITLINGDLLGIYKSRILSEITMKNIKQNLFFALIYNTIGIPIAAGVLFPYFGILLSPMIAAMAMSFSSVSIIANALRLKRINL